MQNLKEKQEIFIRDIIIVDSLTEREIRQRLNEIIECVCDKMIESISDLRKEDTGDAGETMWNNGYDRRIKEEKEIKKSIIESYE